MTTLAVRRLVLPGSILLLASGALADDKETADLYLRCSIALHQAAGRETDSKRAESAKSASLVFMLAASQMTSPDYVTTVLPKVVDDSKREVANESPATINGFYKGKIDQCRSVYRDAHARLKPAGKEK